MYFQSHFLGTGIVFMLMHAPMCFDGIHGATCQQPRCQQLWIASSQTSSFFLPFFYLASEILNQISQNKKGEHTTAVAELIA